MGKFELNRLVQPLKYPPQSGTSGDLDDLNDSIHTVNTLQMQELTPTQLAHITNQIMCPSAEVVSLTDKPHIVAATRDLLGGYFREPEFLGLCQQQISRSSGDDKIMIMLIPRLLSWKSGCSQRESAFLCC